MSINPDKVKRIIVALEEVYPECATPHELNSLLSKADISNFDSELVYCQEKGWVRKTKVGRWRATAKGVDASIKMQKGKECFEVSDP